jgi:hypothetical protein
MTSAFPLRATAWGDAARNWLGRSGTSEVGCVFDVDGLPTAKVRRFADGRIVVTANLDGGDDAVLLDVLLDGRGEPESAPDLRTLRRELHLAQARYDQAIIAALPAAVAKHTDDVVPFTIAGVYLKGDESETAGPVVNIEAFLTGDGRRVDEDDLPELCDIASEIDGETGGLDSLIAHDHDAYMDRTVLVRWDNASRTPDVEFLE